MGRVRLKIWRFVCIYLTAITLSLTFSHLLQMPQKFKYDQNLYMALQHTLYPYYAWVGCTGRTGSGGAADRALLSGAGLAAWFAMVAPANTQMAQWTTVPLPESWMDTRRHWEFGHASSAVLDLIGFGALIASVPLDGTAEIANG